MIKRGMAVFLLGALLFSTDALSGRMKGKCFTYAYETVLGILSESIDTRAKKRAFNIAGDSCRKENSDKCLAYAYQRVLEVYREPTQKSRFKAWGEAVNACRKKIDAKCLQFSEDFFQNARKPRDPYRAFQNAVVSCNSEVKGDCLEYVYQNERERGRSNMAAFNSGIMVCRGGTQKACLQSLFETIGPDARPNARKHWEDAISVCFRK